MPILPQEDLEIIADDERPRGSGVILPTNPTTGLSPDELRSLLAASGERLVTEDQAAVEFARRRRRGGVILSPPNTSASARPSSAATRRARPERGRR
jgi:hypothetical protein